MTTGRKNVKVLIIGGCGYLGSRLFKYLSGKKYKVDTVDLERFGNYVNPRNIKKDYKLLSRLFLKKYKTIILLAGNSSIPMCENKMMPAFKNNVLNFLSLLNKIEDQTFIYASSFRVYGNINKMEVTEKYDRYSPTNYYDLSKKEIDYYAGLSKVNYYGLRMGTVCGDSPNLRVDVMINKMYDSALTKKEIVIFNGSCYRPILGINDFCRCVETIMQKGLQPGLYNLASFKAQIKQIAKVVAKRTGKAKIKNIGNDEWNYNFSMSTQKFENNFKFIFNDSIESIIDSLEKNYKKSVKSIRV